MPRYDKYEPYAGGFRAPLAAATAEGEEFTAVGVGLNTSGNIVLGAGNSGVVGVMIPHGAKKAGDIVDVMTAGEIVGFTADGTEGGSAASAGTTYSVNTSTGAIGTTGKAIGYTVDAQRLVVRFAAGVSTDATA